MNENNLEQKINSLENVKMKLWLLSQQVVCNWDTYDSCVVAAENEYEAKLIHPDGESLVQKEEMVWDTWACRIEDVKAIYLCEAKGGTKRGVICASFNAG